jgi:hypothetical protein
MQRLRSVLSQAGNIAMPPPAQKTFDAEGEVLEHALTKSFRIRRGDQESVFASSAISRRHHQRSQASCHRKTPRSDIALIYRSFARKSLQFGHFKTVKPGEILGFCQVKVFVFLLASEFCLV